MIGLSKFSRLIVNLDTGTIDRVMPNGSIRRNVGSDHGTGYLQLRVDGVLRKMHRFIWEHANGPIPKGYEVDHINGVRSDNRIVNLRLVTHKQNMENRHRARTDNISGEKGVQWKERDGKFQAIIGHQGKKISLGYFLTVDEARIAYVEAAKKFHTHNPSSKK